MFFGDSVYSRVGEQSIGERPELYGGQMDRRLRKKRVKREAKGAR